MQTDAPTALVTGASGVAGRAFVNELVDAGWAVVAASRSERPEEPGVIWVQADLTDVVSVHAALRPHRITHVFHAAQMPPPPAISAPPRLLRLGTKLGGLTVRTLEHAPGPQLQSILDRQLAAATGTYDPDKQNLTMLRNVLDSVQHAPHDLQHVVVVTGGRHYGMHLGPSLYPAYQSHYVEASTPRSPGPNWYFDLEDHLRFDCPGASWTWTVLRPSFLLGVVNNGTHNLGTALGAYVALTDATNTPLDFLGDTRSASVRTDLTSAKQLAKAARWSAGETAAAGQAFNVATGEPFRWQDLWHSFTQSLGRTGKIPKKGIRFAKLARQQAQVWADLAERHDLIEPDLERLASPAYADQMMLLDWDATYDVTKLRDAGFDYFPAPLTVLEELLHDMRSQSLIP